METISVIVPVYNVQAYLSQCIESIINQTYSKLQIILIDDGSTDCSGSISDEWAAKDSRIFVVHQKNEGLSAARNTGLKAAKGEYIAFVDSDDVIHPRTYEFLKQALQETEADVAICHEDAFCDNIYRTRLYDTFHIERIENTEQLVDHFMDHWTGSVNFVWNKLYKKELLNNISFLEGTRLEDLCFSGEVLPKAKRAVWIEERLYGYRQRLGSIMNSADGTLYMEHVKAIMYQRDVLKLEKYDSYALRRIAQLRLEAQKAGEYSISKEIRKIYLSLYKEVDIRQFSCKDKCNVLLARYMWKMYILMHTILKLN